MRAPGEFIVTVSTTTYPSSDRLPLANLIWAPRRGRVALRSLALIALGTALLTLSAKVNVPLPFVPMTMQTLVVVMLGAAYGARLGAATMLAYLAEGALGLPVFAGPVGGIAPLVGPTAGYLIGFVAAAYLTGWMTERGFAGSIARLGAVMALGHLVILGCGFVWLATGIRLGAEQAWLVGVVPFIAGTAVKTALGATLLPALRKLVERRG
jgi:biotin transport system substrate-specific component